MVASDSRPQPVVWASVGWRGRGVAVARRAEKGGAGMSGWTSNCVLISVFTFAFFFFG